MGDIYYLKINNAIRVYYNNLYKFLILRIFMRELKKEEDLMVELDSKFQNKLFTELIKKYSRQELSKKLCKSESILYHYKNNKVKAIPKIVLLRAIKLSSFSEENFEENILRTFSAKDSIKEIMQKGTRINNKKIKERFSIKFGAFSLLKPNNGLLTLDVLSWLMKNNWIANLSQQNGLIKGAKIKRISKKHIQITYFVYNKKTKKCEPYLISLPKSLVLDKNLFYFLGLLFGDGLSGARVGIVNKDKELIMWTSNFLKKYFGNNLRKSQLVLYKTHSDPEIKEFVDWLSPLSERTEVYYNLNARGNYVFNIFITNKILRRILDDFLDNLENLFLSLTHSQKGAFLAGFFDAEGNVNKLDRNLRFSQKIENKVKVILSVLGKEGYHTRYDGSNIIIGFNKEYKEDLNIFKEQIFPFLKQSKKTKETKELIEGYIMREEYRPLLEIISNNPGLSQKQISILIQRVKCNGKLFALFYSGLVDRKRIKVSESFKYYINSQGLKYLEKN